MQRRQRNLIPQHADPHCLIAGRILRPDSALSAGFDRGVPQSMHRDPAFPGYVRNSVSFDSAQNAGFVLTPPGSLQ